MAHSNRKHETSRPLVPAIDRFSRAVAALAPDASADTILELHDATGDLIAALCDAAARQAAAVTQAQRKRRRRRD